MDFPAFSSRCAGITGRYQRHRDDRNLIWHAPQKEYRHGVCNSCHGAECSLHRVQNFLPAYLPVSFFHCRFLRQFLCISIVSIRNSFLSDDSQCCACSETACAGIYHSLCLVCVVDSAGSFYAHIRAYGLSHQGNISRFCTAGRKSGGGFTKSAPASFASSHAFTFSSSVKGRSR